MATLPTELQISADILSRDERADDIERLKSMVELPELDYVDISAQTERAQAFERWPLLAQIKAHQQPAEADLDKDSEDKQ